MCVASLWVSHPNYPYLHLNWSFPGSRWVIGWKFSVWGGGRAHFQTQQERVQSRVLDVITREAWDLLSVFPVTVTALPRTGKGPFPVAECTSLTPTGKCLGRFGESSSSPFFECLPCESPGHPSPVLSSPQLSYLLADVANGDVAALSFPNRICCIWKVYYGQLASLRLIRSHKRKVYFNWFGGIFPFPLRFRENPFSILFYFSICGEKIKHISIMRGFLWIMF